MNPFTGSEKAVTAGLVAGAGVPAVDVLRWVFTELTPMPVEIATAASALVIGLFGYLLTWFVPNKKV